MTGPNSTIAEPNASADAVDDLMDWLASAESANQFRVIAGDQDDRTANLDDLVSAANAADVPVLRLDGTQPEAWTASLTAQLGPLSLKFEFSSSSPSTDDGPVTEPTTPTTSEPTTPVATTELDEAFAQFRDLAREHGGILVVIDDLHRAPADARDDLFNAIEKLDGAVVVAGSDRSSAPDLDRAFTRAYQPDVTSTPATTPVASAAALAASSTSVADASPALAG